MISTMPVNMVARQGQLRGGSATGDGCKAGACVWKPLSGVSRSGRILLHCDAHVQRSWRHLGTSQCVLSAKFEIQGQRLRASAASEASLAVYCLSQSCYKA
jgi:hypothetical protein